MESFDKSIMYIFAEFETGQTMNRLPWAIPWLSFMIIAKINIGIYYHRYQSSGSIVEKSEHMQ